MRTVSTVEGDTSAVFCSAFVSVFDLVAHVNFLLNEYDDDDDDDYFFLRRICT